jgi:hypothetical protein
MSTAATKLNDKYTRVQLSNGEKLAIAGGASILSFMMYITSIVKGATPEEKKVDNEVIEHRRYLSSPRERR